MWLNGDRRHGPKPIGAAHRERCCMPPCAPILKKRAWALELVVQYAPDDTHTAGGPQWAARAIRQIGDGMPRTVAERTLLQQYPGTWTPRDSTAASSTAASEVDQNEGGYVGDGTHNYAYRICEACASYRVYAMCAVGDAACVSEVAMCMLRPCALSRAV